MVRCRLVQVERNVSSDERRYKTNRILLKNSPGFSVRTFRGSINFWRIIGLLKKNSFLKNFEKIQKTKSWTKIRNIPSNVFLKFIWNVSKISLIFVYFFQAFIFFAVSVALFSKIKTTRSFFFQFFSILYWRIFVLLQEFSFTFNKIR